MVRKLPICPLSSFSLNLHVQQEFTHPGLKHLTLYGTVTELDVLVVLHVIKFHFFLPFEYPCVYQGFECVYVCVCLCCNESNLWQSRCFAPLSAWIIEAQMEPKDIVHIVQHSRHTKRPHKDLGVFLIFNYKFIANIEIDLFFTEIAKGKYQYQQQIITEMEKPRTVPIIETLFFFPFGLNIELKPNERFAFHFNTFSLSIQWRLFFFEALPFKTWRMPDKSHILMQMIYIHSQ